MPALLAGGRRQTIRLSTHDYSADSTYFVTLCTYRRAFLFGNVFGGVVRLSPVGRLIRDLWIRTAEMRAGVVLDAFVVMPNHMHAIIALSGSVARKPGSSSFHSARASLQRPPRSLGSLVAGYKSSCTSEAQHLLGTRQYPLWQRNYHERVIRDSRALERMRRYIAENPVRWR
jgi:REP element-mobilizing transposase RayT